MNWTRLNIHTVYLFFFDLHKEKTHGCHGNNIKKCYFYTFQPIIYNSCLKQEQQQFYIFYTYCVSDPHLPLKIVPFTFPV